MTTLNKKQKNQAQNQAIWRDLGLILQIPGLMAIASLPVAFFFAEVTAEIAFFVTAILSFLVGQWLYQRNKLGAEIQDSKIHHAMIVAALSWGLIPFLGTMPFLIIAFADSLNASPTLSAFQNPWNALFESFSGFTGTGLSVAMNPENLPHSLQWWRAFSEWIGGVGIVLLVLAIFEPSLDSNRLYNAEARRRELADNIRQTAKRIWLIYLLYTVLCIMTLRIVGMSWWEAITQGLTAISTGGFSITNQSIGAYPILIQLAVIPFMILGGISFAVHNQFLITKRLKAFFSNPQHRLFWSLLAVGTLLIMAENYWFSGSLHGIASLFQWVSALSTCGFNTVDLQTWSPSAKLLLTIAMICGATAGSTVGGLKLQRIVILLGAVTTRIKRVWQKSHQSQPDQIKNIDQIYSATILAILWVSAIAISVFILLHSVSSDFRLADVIFESASALGNVGLSTGISNPDLPPLGKVTLILLMWMGRLEILPVLVLLSSLKFSVRRPR